MEEITQEVRNKIDEVVEYAIQNDPELKESIAWLDKTDKFSPETNFYERVIAVLRKADSDKRAKVWNIKRQMDECKRQNLRDVNP